jgi:surface protein
MSEMFKQTISFDQDISNWNVVNVTNCLYFSDSQTWTTIPNFTNCTP